MSGYSSLVSQKLAFARMHLVLWRQASENPNAHPVMLRSFRESTLLHAMSAYQAFLLEVAHFYQVGLVGYIQIDVLKKAIADKNKTSPEVAEIENALAMPDGWLSPLMRHYQQIWKPQDNERDEDGGVIAKTASSHVEVLQADECEYYLSNLREFINRIRENTMSEW